MQLIEPAAGGKQLLRRSELNDIPAIDDNRAGGALNRRKAVRNDKRRSTVK
jgi:hypothetical protein